MNWLGEIFNFIFYQPLFLFLEFVTKKIRDFGLAILALVFFIKLILFPINFKVLKNEEKIKKIQEKLKENKEADSFKKIEEMALLYKKEGVNPFFNLLIFFFQLPILVAIYKILRDFPLSFSEKYFFGIFDLSKPNFLFPFLSLIVSFFSLQKQKGKENFLVYPLLFFSFLILLTLPSAISLYIFFNSFFSIIERRIILKKHD